MHSPTHTYQAFTWLVFVAAPPAQGCHDTDIIPPTSKCLNFHDFKNSEKNFIFYQKNLASNPCLRFLSARTATNDPFVYRLGLQVFILARRVRLPYGSPFSWI